MEQSLQKNFREMKNPDPRAEAGNKKLTELLEQTGAKVDDIATYTTCYEKSRLIDEKKELETGSVDCVVFTSASTVKGFVEDTKGLDYTKVKAACIGKQTKAAADVMVCRPAWQRRLPSKVS